MNGIKFSGAFILAGFCLSTAHASSPEERILEPFEACRSIVSSTERLACFDSAVIRATAVANAERKTRVTRTKDDFGLSGIAIAKREQKIAASNPEQGVQRSKERAEIEPGKITAKIRSAFENRKTGNKLYILDNGQIWVQTGSARSKRVPNPGAEVTITKAALGSFKLRITGRKGFVPVKRQK